MAILTLKPHKLEYLAKSDGYVDDFGDYHAGKEKWIDIGECDVVPAGSANQITLPDGTSVQYSFVIYLPPACHEFYVGDRVRILFGGHAMRFEATEFSVKGFHRYQLQSKMWV